MTHPAPLTDAIHAAADLVAAETSPRRLALALAAAANLVADLEVAHRAATFRDLTDPETFRQAVRDESGKGVDTGVALARVVATMLPCEVVDLATALCDFNDRRNNYDQALNLIWRNTLQTFGISIEVADVERYRRIARLNRPVYARFSRETWEMETAQQNVATFERIIASVENLRMTETIGAVAYFLGYLTRTEARELATNATGLPCETWTDTVRALLSYACGYIGHGEPTDNDVARLVRLLA